MYALAVNRVPYTVNNMIRAVLCPMRSIVCKCLFDVTNVLIGLLRRKKKIQHHTMLRGRVHQHVSPFQQQVFKGYLKDIHKRLWVRFKRVAIDVGPIAFLYGYIYYWAAEVKHHNSVAERD
jgi:hypothetical protein